MKTTIISFLQSLLWMSLMAQSPQKMSYQAVIRNNSGQLVANHTVGLRISILQGTAVGSLVYSETYNPAPVTNANGLVTMEIGSGTPVTGTFSGINWANGPYFLKTEADPSGGSNYTITTTSQLLSVPFALYAKDVQNGTKPGGINGNVQFSSSGTFGGDGALNWDNTGKRLGIGITVPEGFLHIAGNSNTLLPQLLLSESEGDYARFSFKNTAATTKNWSIAGRPDPTDANSRLNFWYWNGSSGTDVISITGIGNVGIGTVTPVSKLDVNGTINVNNNKITNVANPASAQDAATKAYVDALIAQLSKVVAIVVDADGNIYPTVRIGSQVWMAENLKTTKYKDGTDIVNETDNYWWGLWTRALYCWYNNDISNKNTYGALYNWYAVNTGKLCPAGWHVPSDAEWTTLTTFLGGEWGEYVAGGKMKETGTVHWDSPNTGATNESGFSALPGGYRSSNGGSVSIGYYGLWWSSTEYSTDYAWHRGLIAAGEYVLRNYSYDKRYGFSVRCLRDL